MTAQELTPILNVSDFDASVAWFEKVGFRPGFQWSDREGGPTTFGAVLWGDVEIFLCLGGQGGRGDHGAWMSIFVDDVDTVHERCRREGLDLVKPVADEPWGVREFHLRHPDGHVLRIGTGAGEAD
jgi:catechol 2,3-dioxygenase-like lactoylglutathione lyase family enzyme